MSILSIVSILFILGNATVTVERNRGNEARPEFQFEKVPSPSRDDAATNAKLTLVGGTIDRNGGDLRALTDGVLPTQFDQPAANLFFRANTWGGRVLIDLGAVTDIEQINTYSWHPSTRGPQLYKIYGADGLAPRFNATPNTKIDPPDAGWTLIAFVDTREASGDEGGQYGVSIAGRAGTIGRYRYLLLDAFETEQEDPWGNTFYSELDVIAADATASPRPTRR